jgi:hypothetical protein
MANPFTPAETKILNEIKKDLEVMRLERKREFDHYMSMTEEPFQVGPRAIADSWDLAKTQAILATLERLRDRITADTENTIAKIQKGDLDATPEFAQGARANVLEAIDYVKDVLRLKNHAISKIREEEKERSPQHERERIQAERKEEKLLAERTAKEMKNVQAQYDSWKAAFRRDRGDHDEPPPPFDEPGAGGPR